MPQCGDVREAKQTSLWCDDWCVCGACVLCVCMDVYIRALTCCRVTRLGGRKI